MKLADKPCYPITLSNFEEIKQSGLTFRERLIIAGFSNPKFFESDGTLIFYGDKGILKYQIIEQADAIIKELEKEKK